MQFCGGEATSSPISEEGFAQTKGPKFGGSSWRAGAEVRGAICSKVGRFRSENWRVWESRNGISATICSGGLKLCVALLPDVAGTRFDGVLDQKRGPNFWGPSWPSRVEVFGLIRSQIGRFRPWRRIGEFSENRQVRKFRFRGLRKQFVSRVYNFAALCFQPRCRLF